MTMTEVFLSYSHQDRDIARRYADALEAAGLSVWWDDHLRSGEAFDEKIEAALRAAKAVVVLWSKTSVASRWVRAEATLADRNKTLVPVMIEPCERPIMFELTHTSDLGHWQGDAADSAGLGFLGDVRGLVGRAFSAPEQSPIAATIPAPAKPGQRGEARALAEHVRAVDPDVPLAIWELRMSRWHADSPTRDIILDNFRALYGMTADGDEA